ncbi:MAG: response regulator, partial [Solirubrobacterales bacterium]|nr:response regulator [Solirubrobacterales bacterium]
MDAGGQGRERLDARGAIHALFAAGGDMGELMARLAWDGSPLGEPETWPESLRTAVGICLESRFPMLVWWGPELAMLYNDAYRPILGASKHPAALGRPGVETWGEIWDVIGPMLAGVVERGEATWSEDQLLLMDRYGFEEETYFTFSYSPIRGETGTVDGIFTAVSETTEQVVGARRLRCLRALAEVRGSAMSIAEAVTASVGVLEGFAADVPFAIVHLVDETGAIREAGAAAGLARVPPASAWPLRQVHESGVPAEVDASPAAGQLRAGRAADRAVVLPVGDGAGGTPAVMVCGVSSRRPLDHGYRDFLRLVADDLGTSIAAAEAREHERRRAQELAELDAAKTTFFSNISHELRTPLTLLLGPLEELLGAAGSLDAQQREALEGARRNGLRLRRLVDALLDFSRLSAGRLRPTFRAVDLAATTGMLAGAFRSAAQMAGLELDVRCPPLGRTAYVDPEHWETIVLNLLSNALKHTWEGGITVELREHEDRAELTVRDTGTGIPAEELPHLFERFHQVQGARARSVEGAGIGLALVDELVRLHGGTVTVESEVGAGSTFTVCVPFGEEHAGQEAAGPFSPAAAEGVAAEAERWQLPDGTAKDPVPAEAAGVPTVLVADDSADMRDYFVRLLRGHVHVRVVPDGVAALEEIRREPPDLVLTDVMMPRLDGYGLLRALREDPATARLPVIMVSARAGEESAVEGLDAGADDYLVKPFTRLELLARVRSTLQTSALRERATTQAVERGDRLQALVEAGMRVDAQVREAEVLRAVVREARELCGAARVTAEDGAGLASGEGDADADGERLRLPLPSEGVLQDGQLTLVAATGEHFDAEARALAAQLALLAAGALSRARLHARERATVEALQRSLLPQELPSPHGLHLAARYLPAGEDAAVGGDWYDVVELPRERTAIVVGDVVGHGLPAAATMSHLRNVLRAYLGEGLSPADAVARMHA